MQVYGRVAVAPLRAEPSDPSEMVSQLLFGEAAEVLESQKKWVKIKIRHDGYEGWVDPKQIAEIQFPEQYEQRNVSKEAFNLILVNNTPMTVPMGCFVSNANEEVQWGADTLRFMGEVRDERFSTKLEVVELAKKFLNVPYLWGGRSHFGIDCSGLMQQLYRAMGIELPRDAYQQAELGEVLNFVMESEPGDLAFFDNDEGKIIHVGIMLNQNEILHAHGCVRVDPLDSTGIFNHESKAYSHKLRFVRRL